MKTSQRLPAKSWRDGYPDDYVTANAICLHEEFDPDEDRSVRVGFRCGYSADPTYHPDLYDYVANFIDYHWQRFTIFLGLVDPVTVPLPPAQAQAFIERAGRARKTSSVAIP
jgi:hypothetical protein